MRKLVNYLRGMIRIEVSGAFPERVVNLCAQNRVEFWAVEWPNEHTVRMSIRARGLKEAQRFSEKTDCELRIEWSRGVPQFLSLFRQRYGFLAGLTLALLTVAILSGFVLSIEITGNERVSDAEILQQLQRHGLRVGVYAPALDRRQMEQEILLELKDLSWMTINLKGTRVEVQVLETTQAPERIDERGFYHIVSRADGIVTGIEPELGDALVREGDIVGKGDVLISGTVTLEPPKYSDLPARYYQTHARGRVWARTWHQFTTVIPETAQVKRWSGQEKTCHAIIFFGTRVEFFGNSSISDGLYDKITSVRQAVLPGGIAVPIWIVEERYRGYEMQAVCIDRDAAADMIKEEVGKHLKALAGEDGSVLTATFETRITDGMIRVNVVGECLEEIGQELCADTEE